MLNHSKLEEVNWKSELKDLMATAKTPDEKAATEAFAKAIGPYLDRPDLLRTLLGKIQAAIPSEALSIVVAQRQFGSLEELKSKLPRSVDVVSL